MSKKKRLKLSKENRTMRIQRMCKNSVYEKKRVSGLDQVFYITMVSLGLLGCSAKLGGGESAAIHDDSSSGNECTSLKRCDNLKLEVCEKGDWKKKEDCKYGCNASFGCFVCDPSEKSCEKETSVQCEEDGSGYTELFCDSELGLHCSEGVCHGSCAPQALGKSYIGCEYFPTVSYNAVNPMFPFAVSISNAGVNSATIQITGGTLSKKISFVVPPQGIVTQDLPWVPTLKRCNENGFLGCVGRLPLEVVLVKGGSYHVKSTEPVTVYQLSPRGYHNGNPGHIADFTHSNDSSLLLPRNAMSGDYVAVTRVYGNFVVTATEDDTLVTVTLSTDAAPSASGLPAFRAKVPTKVRLEQGDVFQLPALGDLTGTIIEADHPVQVVAGTECSSVPQGFDSCDHLEESMFPIQALSNEYLVTLPQLPASSEDAYKGQFVRIVAVENDTSLVYDPPLLAQPTQIAKSGRYIEIGPILKDFKVTANRKILVAQFIGGGGGGRNGGQITSETDPSMSQAVPIGQYRTDYLFHAPVDFKSNYVNITRKAGARILLDGVEVGNWQSIGGSEFQVSRIKLSNGPQGTGDHRATSELPFGISVYGYGVATSYWYPGGLNLDEIKVVID